MMLQGADAEVLQSGTAREHIARFYQRDEHLVRDVAAYLLEGAKRGDSLLVAATPEHWEDVSRELRSSGLDTDLLDRQGRLKVLDAVATLPQLMGETGPDRNRFRPVVGAALQDALRCAPSRRLRVFGELVDLLWKQGEQESALTLERMWDDLQASLPFSLLCAYQVDLLDPNGGAVDVERICTRHTHALRSKDRAHLDRAVDAAFIEVLGAARAAALRPLIEATICPNGSFGQAERTVFWMRRNLPGRLRPLLAQAREHLENPTAV